VTESQRALDDILSVSFDSRCDGNADDVKKSTSRGSAVPASSTSPPAPLHQFVPAHAKGLHNNICRAFAVAQNFTRLKEASPFSSTLELVKEGCRVRVKVACLCFLLFVFVFVFVFLFLFFVCVCVGVFFLCSFVCCSCKPCRVTFAAAVVVDDFYHAEHFVSAGVQ
jgi:hypothetical protein